MSKTIHYVPTRDKKGRFARIKSKIKRYFWTLVVLGNLAAAYQAYQWHEASLNYLREHGVTKTVEALAGDTNQAAEAIAQRLLIEKLETLQYELVDQLAAECETKERKEPDSVIIFDSNDEPSIGAWQYQRKTVKTYYKKFYGEDINLSQAISIAIDHTKARELTRKILFEEKGERAGGGWGNWTNCALHLGLPAKIDLLNKLSSI